MSTSPRDRLPDQPLQKSLADLIGESQALRADVHTAEQARRQASRINLLAVGVLAVFVALLIVVTWQNNQLAHQVQDTNERMADCTTPGGACYAQSTKRTGDAITDVLLGYVYVSQCARLYPGESGPAFDRKMEQCVFDRLAQHRAAANRSPAPSPAPTVSPR